MLDVDWGTGMAISFASAMHKINRNYIRDATPWWLYLSIPILWIKLDLSALQRSKWYIWLCLMPTSLKPNPIQCESFHCWRKRRKRKLKPLTFKRYRVYHFTVAFIIFSSFWCCYIKKKKTTFIRFSKKLKRKMKCCVSWKHIYKYEKKNN